MELKTTPKWKHHCSQCVYVGTVNELDLYYCTPDDNIGPTGYPKDWLQVSYLARYNDIYESQYASGSLRHPENVASSSVRDISLRIATIQACAFAIYGTLVK